jgi:hypothetical protein
MSFSELKKNRSKSFEALNEQLSSLSNKSYSDPEKDTYWKPTQDKAGNGFAIIRFLPGLVEEGIGFIRYWDHGFQGPGGWYIEKSLNSIGAEDPVAKYNTKLWNSSSDDTSPERRQAREQKRRLHYVSNIYVIKDSGNPENEGKVFRFRYGAKIWNKINDLMYPQFDDEKAINPFDLWEGANFRLKVRIVEGYTNYDKSEFDTSSALFDDDTELENVYQKQYPLKSILDPKNYKSYDELEAKLYKVLGLNSSGINDKPKKTADDEMNDVDLDVSNLGKSQPEKSSKSKAAPEPEVADDEDDDLAFFQNLAKG